jgi:hypothetical protein
VEELFGYWKEYPPMHILVNAYFVRAGSRPGKSHGPKQADRLGEIKRAVLAVGGEAKRILPDVYRGK